MRKKSTYDGPLKGPLGAVAKFFAAALFGGFVSLLVFFVVLLIGIDAFWQSPWPHVLWIIPLVWGVLGIFWFERMIDMARDLVETVLGVEN